MFLKLTLCRAGFQRPGLELQLENAAQKANLCVVAMENIDWVEPLVFGTPEGEVLVSKIHTKRGLSFNVEESVSDIALMLGYQYGVIEQKTITDAMKPKCAAMPPKEL